MSGYWHMYVICPYFAWENKTAIGCEGKTVHRFPKGRMCRSYQEKYCAGNWQECTYAKVMNEYYEQEQGEKDGKS